MTGRISGGTFIRQMLSGSQGPADEESSRACGTCPLMRMFPLRFALMLQLRIRRIAVVDSFECNESE